MFITDDIYPFSLPLSVLEFKNVEYKDNEYVWSVIDDLVNGGKQILKNKTKYISQRPGEENWVYQKRLERFTYRNVIGKAVNDLVAKLSLGSMQVINTNDKEFWEVFLSNIDRKQSKDHNFISEILRHILKFKSVYLHVDKPQPEILIETELDAERYDPDPYVEIIEPYKVLNWENNNDGSKKWIKIRYVEEVVNKFNNTPKLKATWIFIDDNYKAVYSSFVKWGHDGNLTIEDPKSVDKVTGEPLVDLERPVIDHGYGRLPVVCVEVPDHLWSCNQAFLLALEHLNIHNAKYDTTLISSYVQRTVETQELQTSDQDLDNTYVLTRRQEDQTEKLLSGNPYILKAKTFMFNEATGKPVEMAEKVLDKLVNQIEAIVGLTGYLSKLEGVEQSGISKEFDLIVQEILLRIYGDILIKGFNAVLQLVCISKNLNTDVYATGLNRFNLDNLDNLVDIASKLEPFETRLAPTALKLFYGELQTMLAKNANPTDERQIASESDAIWRVFNPANNDVE